MGGFLRDFRPHYWLVRKNDHGCLRSASTKAVELAMLGLTDEALAIFSVLHAHPSFAQMRQLVIPAAKKMFLHAVGESRLTEEELQQEQLQAVQTNVMHVRLEPNVDWANVTAEDYQRLHTWAEEVERSRWAMAETGFDVG